MIPAPRDVPELLQSLQASDPGRPRLTWYGPDGERVELSARVLDNWVAKTANLLVEELDAGPGTTVRLALPPHWRTAVWALAASAVGAELVEGDADVVVTDVPSATGDDARVVVVALPALATSAGLVPPGALDYNAEVSGYGDVYVPVAPPAALPPLHAWPDDVRLLVDPATWDVVDAVIAPLTSDGSVVLLGHPMDGARRRRLVREERVTAGA